MVVKVVIEFPEERIRLARPGPALGVHAGPGILFVALRGRALSSFSGYRYREVER